MVIWSLAVQYEGVRTFLIVAGVVIGVLIAVYLISSRFSSRGAVIPQQKP